MDECAQGVDGGVPVAVAYATPQREFVRPLTVAPGTTLGQAIEASGVLASFPEINLVTQPVGIHGKKKTLETVVRAHDRIEIYRALVADPKDSRRKRAARKEGAAAPTSANPRETAAVAAAAAPADPPGTVGAAVPAAGPSPGAAPLPAVAPGAAAASAAIGAGDSAAE